MHSSILIDILFSLTIVEAITIVTWCLHKRRQVLQELLAPDPDLGEQSEARLSPAEAAFIVSRGDQLSTLGVLILDAERNPDPTYMELPEGRKPFGELIARDPAIYEVNREQKELLGYTFDKMNSVFGRRVRQFISTRVLSLSKPSLAFRHIATQAQSLVYRGGDVVTNYCHQMKIDLRSRGLVVSAARLAVARKQLADLQHVPILGTSSTIVVTMLILMVFSGGNGTSVPNVGAVIAIGLMEFLVFFLWVAVASIPAALLKRVWAFELPKNWIPVLWAITEMPQFGPRQVFARAVLSIGMAFRPLGVLAIAWLFWNTVVGVIGPQNQLFLSILCATMAATYGWIVHYTIGEDRKKLSTDIVATRAGLAELRAMEERASHSSPTSILGNSLNSEFYDPRFSEVVALYGLEVLWLLESEDVADYD